MLDHYLLLSVSPAREDHTALRELLAGEPWLIRECHSLRSASMVLEEYRIPVVLCEADLHFATWRDLIAQVARTSNPPSVIVSSRQADENLWVEALNAGAFDVLAKPFDRCELLRSLTDGAQRWYERLERAPLVMTAAE